MLMSRTVAQVHRETEASLVATQLLPCRGALAMPVPQNGDYTLNWNWYCVARAACPALPGRP